MLPGWYPNEQDVDDGNFIRRHIEAIALNRRAISLFVKTVDFNPSHYKTRSLRNPNFTEYIFHIRKTRLPFRSLINGFRYFFCLYREFMKIVATEGLPEICHVHVISRSGIFGYYLKKRHKIPLVISEHWSGYYPPIGKLTALSRTKYRIILRSATCISTVSDFLAEQIRMLGISGEIRIIPNLVDDVFFNTSLASGEEKELKHIVHISNLNRQLKRVDQLLNALNEMASRRTDFDVSVFGDGRELSELRNYAGSLSHLRNRLQFMGQHPEDEIASFFQKSSVTVLYSRIETQSVVLLESIAMGVPVVAPEVGGIPEHSTGHGELFPEGDQNAFIEAVDRVLNNPEKYDPEEMRKYAIERFSKSKINDRFNELYDSLSISG